MAIKAHKLGPGSLIFGETASQKEFASQTRTTSITPEVDDEDDLPVLSGEVIDGEETYTWTLSGTILDGYTMDALAVWAFENRGEVLPFEFIPNADVEGAMKWTGKAKIRPIAHGGEVKTKNENDFEFKVIGDPKPELVA